MDAKPHLISPTGKCTSTGQNFILSVSLQASISELMVDGNRPLRGRGNDRALRIGPDLERLASKSWRRVPVQTCLEKSPSEQSMD